MEYVGQTIDQFLSRWNNYKSDSRKHSQGATCLNNFCTSGNCGFLKNVSLIFIDKTDPSDLLKREDYRRSTLKTVAPFGLNIEESV